VAAIGALLAMPLLGMVTGYLWQIELRLKPRPATDLELSAMAMSVPALILMALLFAPPLGAAVGAAWMALRLGARRAAGRWCVTAGGVTALAVVALCLVGGDPGEQLAMALLPWRGGYLLWSLLLIGWGVRALTPRRPG
jgi:hypothetical protein